MFIVLIILLTGLDPAEPDFEDTDNAVHLEKTDALFVDIIHSDGSEFDYVSGMCCFLFDGMIFNQAAFTKTKHFSVVLKIAIINPDL